MPRPPRCRRVAGKPGACVFKPAGVPACRLQWLDLTLDEFEAMRLADLDGLHQEEAAARMRVSRQTFGRIVENARRKVTQVLASGMALNIEGGTVRTVPEPRPRCSRKDGFGSHRRRLRPRTEENVRRQRAPQHLAADAPSLGVRERRAGRALLLWQVGRPHSRPRRQLAARLPSRRR